MPSRYISYSLKIIFFAYFTHNPPPRKMSFPSPPKSLSCLRRIGATYVQCDNLVHVDGLPSRASRRLACAFWLRPATHPLLSHMCSPCEISQSATTQYPCICSGQKVMGVGVSMNKLSPCSAYFLALRNPCLLVRGGTASSLNALATTPAMPCPFICAIKRSHNEKLQILRRPKQTPNSFVFVPEFFVTL